MSVIKKKREERHEGLLAIAQGLLIEDGPTGLNIGRLAKQAGYSRPTVYDHFGSRKGVMEALARQNVEVTRGLIGKASKFEGTSREKGFALMLAYEILARFHTAEFHVTEFLAIPWVRCQLPAEIATSFSSAVAMFSGSVRERVEEAVAAGELLLSAGLTAEDIASHSLSMTYGIYTSIVNGRTMLALSEPANQWAEARASLHRYWDGLGWAGSSEELNYAEVAETFMREVFTDYWVELRMEQVKKEAGISNGAEGATGATGG